VLVVVTDAVPHLHGEHRTMPNAVTVSGDGAAACLLSSRLSQLNRVVGTEYEEPVDRLAEDGRLSVRSESI
jgi:hypothetical protein